MEFLPISQQSKDEIETESVSEKLENHSVFTQLAVQGDFTKGFN
jgi:hypothetical protein